MGGWSIRTPKATPSYQLALGCALSHGLFFSGAQTFHSEAPPPVPGGSGKILGKTNSPVNREDSFHLSHGNWVLITFVLKKQTRCVYFLWMNVLPVCTKVYCKCG